MNAGHAMTINLRTSPLRSTTSSSGADAPSSMSADTNQRPTFVTKTDGEPGCCGELCTSFPVAHLCTIPIISSPSPTMGQGALYMPCYTTRPGCPSPKPSAPLMMSYAVHTGPRPPLYRWGMPLTHAVGTTSKSSNCGVGGGVGARRPTGKAPGITPKAYAVGRPLHWVVKPGMAYGET